MIKIYVGNLSFDITESEIRELFSEHGAVESVHIVTDNSTGQPRGFGFVQMASDDDAQSAVKSLDGFELSGKTLIVNMGPHGSGGGIND